MIYCGKNSGACFCLGDILKSYVFTDRKRGGWGRRVVGGGERGKVEERGGGGCVCRPRAEDKRKVG